MVKMRGSFPVPGEPTGVLKLSPRMKLDVRKGVRGSNSLGCGNSENRVLVRAGAVKEGFLGEGTQVGCINSRIPQGQAPPSAGQEARMWLISSWVVMFGGRVCRTGWWASDRDFILPRNIHGHPC